MNYDDIPLPALGGEAREPMRNNEIETCEYAVEASGGEQEPCGRPATCWRWYQDCDHEDALDVACDWHANEGGRRIAEMSAALDAVTRERDEAQAAAEGGRIREAELYAELRQARQALTDAAASRNSAIDALTDAFRRITAARETAERWSCDHTGGFDEVLAALSGDTPTQPEQQDEQRCAACRAEDHSFGFDKCNCLNYGCRCNESAPVLSVDPAPTRDEQQENAYFDPDAAADALRPRLIVTVDRLRYDVAGPPRIITGAALRKLPFPPIGDDADVYAIRFNEPDRIVRDTDEVELFNGARFYTAPRFINSGAPVQNEPEYDFYTDPDSLAPRETVQALPARRAARQDAYTAWGNQYWSVRQALNLLEVTQPGQSFGVVLDLLRKATALDPPPVVPDRNTYPEQS